MTEEESNTSQFERDATAAEHLQLASIHLYKACCAWSKVVLPPPHDPDARDMLLDAKYRAQGAHRRGIQSVRSVCVDMITPLLAELEGQDWPTCGRGIPLNMPDVEANAIKATRRQWYRDGAIKVVAKVFAYIEQGDDTESQRQRMLDTSRQQRADDAVAVSIWRAEREAAAAAREFFTNCTIAKGTH